VRWEWQEFNGRRRQAHLVLVIAVSVVGIRIIGTGGSHADFRALLQKGAVSVWNTEAEYEKQSTSWMRIPTTDTAITNTNAAGRLPLNSCHSHALIQAAAATAFPPSVRQSPRSIFAHR